jgi:putative Mg2+ transporter-C (MgtC) family protein
MDPGRLSAQILSGIGFLGAGAILKTSNGIRGLTTAAGIWATACIGIAVGYGYYELAIFGWLFVMGTLFILKHIDKVFFKQKSTILEITIYQMDVIPYIYGKLNEVDIKIKHIEINYVNNQLCKIEFFINYDRRLILKEIIKELNDFDGIANVEYLQ